MCCLYGKLKKLTAQFSILLLLKIAVLMRIKSRTCAHFLRYGQRHLQRIWYEWVYQCVKFHCRRWCSLSDNTKGPAKGNDRTCQAHASHHPICHWLYALCENAQARGQLWSSLLFSVARNVLSKKKTVCGFCTCTAHAVHDDSFPCVTMEYPLSCISAADLEPPALRLSQRDRFKSEWAQVGTTMGADCTPDGCRLS